MTPRSNHEIQRHALDYWQIIRNRLGVITLSFLTIFTLAAVMTYVMPRKYRGRVEMVIERNQDDVRVEGHSVEVGTAMTENFLKTQFEIISKRKTLDRVVEKLDLVKRWNLPNKSAASGRLQGGLDAQSSVKSDFISIEYYDEDRQLAADIANAMAESYSETRIEVNNERDNSAIEQLTVQIANKEQLTRQSLDKMIAIKRRLGIIEMPGSGDHRAAGTDTVLTPESATVITSTNDVYKIKKEIQDMSAQVQLLQKLDGDELIRQAGELKVENDTIKKLAPQYQDLLLKREQLRTSLGAKHPTMRSLEAQLVETRRLLLDAAKDFRGSLGLKVEIAQNQLIELEKLNQAGRKVAQDAQVDNQEYLRARKEWEIMEGELAKLKDTKSQKESDVNIHKTPVTVYQKAEAEGRPAKPNVSLNLALGAAVGLLFGLGIAFFLEYLDTSVKSLDDVERFLGLPVLGVIPKKIKILLHTSGMTADSEAYRILRTNIEFNRQKAEANCITVVSGSPGEGKSTTMVNLATVCAQGGYTTLIVDADMRRPSQHLHFEVSNTCGLSNYLSSNVALQEVVVRTPVENLYYMPSGPTPADPAGLLNSKKFSEFIADMKSRFDVVLLDSPPILGVSDAAVLAAEADMTLLVVQHRKLPRNMLMRAKLAVEQVGGSVIGVVLNNVNLTTDTSYAYYTTYYTYYSGAKDGAKKRRSKQQRKKTPKDSAPATPVAQEAPAEELF